MIVCRGRLARTHLLRVGPRYNFKAFQPGIEYTRVDPALWGGSVNPDTASIHMPAKRWRAYRFRLRQWKRRLDLMGVADLSDLKENFETFRELGAVFSVSNIHGDSA